MKIRLLRHIANRYGPAGLLIVGGYLVILHLWMKRRVALLSVLALIIGSCTFNLCFNRSVSSNGKSLYLGWVRTSERLKPLDERILVNWKASARTAEVHDMARQFSRHVQRQERIEAIRIGDRMLQLYQPPDWCLRNKDGKWLFRAETAEIYLEQAWLDEADREFREVLASVPSRESSSVRSPARQIASYSLARICALRGAYKEALIWFTHAPRENGSGCGNNQELMADRDYPTKVVWGVATWPFPDAEAELQQVMRGRFQARWNGIYGDTSQGQREHAAVEAALALGCLYARAGRRKDAETCLRLVAFNADSQYEATVLAQSMLRHFQGE